MSESNEEVTIVLGNRKYKARNVIPAATVFNAYDQGIDRGPYWATEEIELGDSITFDELMRSGKLYRLECGLLYFPGPLYLIHDDVMRWKTF